MFVISAIPGRASQPQIWMNFCVWVRVCVCQRWGKQRDKENCCKKKRQDMRDTQLQDVKRLKMCYPWKASSSLLPWQRSLLGNSVAMARVSSMMQTRPHPPTPQQLRGAGRLYYGLCVCERERGCVFPFFFQTANFLWRPPVSPFPVGSTDLWPPLVFRRAAPLLGLERTRHVWRRFSHGRLSATAGSCSKTSSDWLRGRTLSGCVRHGGRLGGQKVQVYIYLEWDNQEYESQTEYMN